MPHEVFGGEPEFYSQGTPVRIVKKGVESLLEPIYWNNGTPLLAMDGSTEEGGFNALLVMINN